MVPPINNISELYDSQTKYDERCKNTHKPAMIGALLLISACLNFPLAIINLEWWGMAENNFIFMGFAMFFLFSACLCFIGGGFSFKRRYHKIVLAASALAVIPTVIFGLAALVLLASAEDEFLS